MPSAPGVPLTKGVIIAGPTGGGKSALAAALAASLSGVVINADSMQVYRELRILTARPGTEEERRAPHRLYGILTATDPCSVGRWLALATTEINSAQAAGQLPVVTGGTGLYLKALTDGLSPVPEIDPRVRQAARRLLREGGAEGVRDALSAIDPEAAARLADGQRLARAYEVATATGRPLSAWTRLPPAAAPPGRGFFKILLSPPRADHGLALDRRFAAMLAAGAIDEVRALLDLRLDPDLPAMKAVGVAELSRYIRGQTTLGAAVAAAVTATRRYAKRQRTWFRHHFVADKIIEEKLSECMQERICMNVRHLLLTAEA